MKTAAERKASSEARSQEIYKMHLALLRKDCEQDMDIAEGLGRNYVQVSYLSYSPEAAKVIADELGEKGYQANLLPTSRLLSIRWN